MKLFSRLLAVAVAAAMVAPTGVHAQVPANQPPSLETISEREAVTGLQLSQLNGVWKGHFPVYTSDIEYFIEPVTIDINSSRSQPILLNVYSVDRDCYLQPNDWRIENDTLYFSFYEGSWYARASVKLYPDDKLEGVYAQKRNETALTFTRTSYRPAREGKLQTDFVLEGKTGQEWLDLLRQHPGFTHGKTSIPFTYSLVQWDKSGALVERYHLDDLLDGRSDVAQMEAVMQIMRENFSHNGEVVLGSKMDAMSVIAQHDANGGIECRGLSIILSEMLRSIGIEAKPIMCISAFEPAECHVVVHAYSRSLGQWIMIDPTYRLMLENEAGQYVSLPMLRDALIKGEPLYANADAGYNEFPFSMAFYRAYMSKNTFRFSSATKFYYGGEQFADTDVKAAGTAYYNKNKTSEPMYMLVPVGYQVPYQYSRSEKVTTDEDAFWAAPK